MSNLETLLNAWLNDGEVPAGFEPETRIEEYLVAILDGVDDDVTPESRADVLLDAIAAKYAGYADGITDLRDETGMTEHHVSGSKPDQIAAFLRLENALALQDLTAKGATGVNANTTDILTAYSTLPSGGTELNIGYGDTAPEDTTKLWVKTAQPQNVTVDYDIDNGVESVTQLTTVLSSGFWGNNAAPAIGKKVFLLGGSNDYYITEYNTESGAFTSRSVGYHMSRASGVVIGNKIYIISPTNTNIYEYDTETYTLTVKTALMPNIVEQVGVGVVGSKLYIFGGVHGYTRYNTICVYDTVSDTISTLPVTLPTYTSGIGVGVVGTKIYLFGGQTSNGSLDTIGVFYTDTNTLTTLSATLPQERYVPTTAVYGTKCYLIGGGCAGIGLLDTIAVFDAVTETATTLAATLPKAEGGAGGAVVGADCYLFGGWDGSVNLTTINKFTITFSLNEGDVYLQTDVFKNKFTLLPAPTEVKTGVSAVYVGNASNYAETAEAYLYDENTSAWAPLT